MLYYTTKQTGKYAVHAHLRCQTAEISTVRRSIPTDMHVPRMKKITEPAH